MSTLIIIVVALAIFFLVIKVGNSFSAEKKINKKRVAELIDTDESFLELKEDFSEEKSGLAVALEGLVSGFRNVKAEKEELTFKLYRAGASSPNAVAYYLFFSTFGWMIGAGVLVLFYILGQSNPGYSKIIYLVGIINAALFTFGAQLWVKNSTEKREKIMLRSFPDMLDLLLVCVESGLALDAALARVCKELKYAHPEITEELNKTRIELTMLNDRERALTNFSKRMDILAVKSLVAALIQSEKFGTSLIETLRVLSDDYRQTRIMIAEEKAGKLPTKIAASTLPFMLCALLLLIASPAVIRAGEVLDSSGVTN